jgi:hypothetical protein
VRDSVATRVLSPTGDMEHVDWRVMQVRAEFNEEFDEISATSFSNLAQVLESVERMSRCKILKANAIFLVT